MFKTLFFFLAISSLSYTSIVNASVQVELDSCVKHLGAMSKKDIEEMVVALHLGNKSVKTIFGSEHIDGESFYTEITSLSVGMNHSKNSLTKNVVDIKIDGTDYACYPKN